MGFTDGIAIVPARGGSKRLPRKNVLPFRGRPILAYTVDAARATGRFSAIIVSTEDDEIAAVAKAAGAEIHRRPPALATDAATVVEVCIDVLDRKAEAGVRPAWFACLYATAPLRTAADIATVVDLLDPPETCFGMAVTAIRQPPHAALRRAGDGKLAPMWPDLIERRASDFGELVIDNGSTYAVMVEPFRAARTFYGKSLRGHVMPRERSVDIDYPDDFALAEYFAARAGTR
jgi:CMP-N-acetylneuraminic acid synthetase